MPSLYLYDDATARGFEPFALTRPISEMRAGAEITRRRWARALGAEARGFVSAPHLAAFEELDAPPSVQDVIPAGSIVANARAIVSLASSVHASSVDASSVYASSVIAWTIGERVAAVRLAADVPVSQLADGTLSLDALLAPDATRTEIGGRWVERVWDFIGQLSTQLDEDLRTLGPTLAVQELDVHIIGDRSRVFVEQGAIVEPFVVLDASAGPIVVRAGATVHSFTRVVGPCFVASGSTVAGDKIAGCSIGEGSRIHGEISTTIVLGHANKSHDGFVGHSYLGRWVNLGAGTITSNLKNTYGPVALWTPEGIRSTGLQFLGTMFGDHAKVGIGMRLTTGSVIGAGANVYDRMPPKVVAPFAWGGEPPYGAYAVDKFLDVAAHVMSRRGITLGDGGRAVLRAAHARGRENAAQGRYSADRADG